MFEREQADAIELALEDPLGPGEPLLRQRRRHRLDPFGKVRHRAPSNDSIYFGRDRGDDPLTVLALLGLATVVLLLALILSRRHVAARGADRRAHGRGDCRRASASTTATVHPRRHAADGAVAAMFVFAILYFGVMTDAGMLDPIVDRILRAVGTRPTRIVVGSALLALLVHLDGSGRGDVSRDRARDAAAVRRACEWTSRILACVASLAAGVNFLPWTGPDAARVGGAAHLDDRALSAADSRAAGRSGVRLPRRVPAGHARGAPRCGPSGDAAADRSRSARQLVSTRNSRLRRPRRFWINVPLTAS